MNQRIVVLAILASAMTMEAQTITADRIYFTSTLDTAGTPVEPGFAYNYIWNGIGTGYDGHQYLAVSNHDEAEGGGDVALADYNPYDSTMRSLGTVVGAYKAAGNEFAGEYCNKVHTWLCPTPDGRVWLGSQNGGRGSHLLYIQTDSNRVVDYSRTQKYIYLTSPTKPALNHPELAPAADNGVSIQNCDFTTMNINPCAPRYIWTESYTNFYFHCWDTEADTTYAYPGGNGDLRVLLVDRKGALWYSANGSAYRRAPTGAAKRVGQALPLSAPGGSAFVFSRSYDSAFTSTRGDGQILLFDFARDTVTVIADLPDEGAGWKINQAYRALAVSADNRKLYALGDSGKIYEILISDRSYSVVGSVRSLLPGGYAVGSGNMDTLGNWYLACFGGNGHAYLLRIRMGRGRITGMPVPDPVIGVENIRLAPKPVSLFSISPNPAASRVFFTAGPLATGQRLTFGILTADGRRVGRLGPLFGGQTAVWNAPDAPAGLYFVEARSGQLRMVRKLTRE